MARFSQEAAAGGVGATGGTVLLAVIRTLPNGTPGKEAMLYMAPTVGVGITLAARIGVRLLDARLRHRRTMRSFHEAMELQRSILHHPASTRDERTDARAELSRLSRQRTIYMRDRITSDELADLRHLPLFGATDPADEPIHDD